MWYFDNLVMIVLFCSAQTARCFPHFVPRTLLTSSLQVRCLNISHTHCKLQVKEAQNARKQQATGPQ